MLLVAISAIPEIVCETIHSLKLHDETPSWKIMDNKGRVTVVLHWDQRPAPPSRTSSEAPSPAPQQPKYSPSRRPSLVPQITASKKETLINDVYQQSQPHHTRYTSPQITVINHDEVKQPHRLSKQGSSLESATIHIHTSECANHVHQPRPGPSSQMSNGWECDFHCCALHEEGRKIAVHKSVATSPIQDAQQQTSPQPPSRHVRFLDVEGGGRHTTCSEHESSESETENTVMEDEAVTSEKFLLLIDQLSVDQKKHLTIKEIGIILERLESKIVDVERLDRESESDDCYNWTIKATIRGESMRDMGVLYNGNYYAISEHPGYKDDADDDADEVDDDDEEEEEEEEDDRL